MTVVDQLKDNQTNTIAMNSYPKSIVRINSIQQKKQNQEEQKTFFKK